LSILRIRDKRTPRTAPNAEQHGGAVILL